ncbi:hypothetical protein J2Z31_004621 [Sinorhizobium kostiense]|uniref:Uncharacterized protein n=1 Tax=Sinorhizobium kostiense TaxID=76747 RepID=A0ABS4R723_9HYPH|nr:hypothetical protein [Sinorhizobium kostiense]MBP2238094.1 hypothetical protein [Sinorhizobium kostiense]
MTDTRNAQPADPSPRKRPTMVTDIGSDRIMLEIWGEESVELFGRLGFERIKGSERTYRLRADTDAVFAMCQVLRDMGIPFATHRHMGADYQVEYLREKGLLSGVFKRINFFGNDWDEEAPYRLEEF